VSLIPTYPALLAYECAFNAGPTGTSLPPYWSDITARTTFAWSTARGRQYELDTNPAGQWNTALDNRDGALDPSNTSSPYYPDVIPYRPCRIRARLGVNALTVDQATAGQGTSLPPGLSGQGLSALLGISNDFGYTVSLAASGSAYTGSQAYQVTLPAGSAANTTILLLSPAPVVPGQWYSATAQVRIPSGSTVTCNTAILYYTSAGAQVSATGGTAASITAGSSTWTALTVSAQAPTGASAAYYATIKVEITASVASSTAVQVGALQWEQSATATPWQAPQSLPANLLPQVIATGSQSMNPATDSAYNWWYVLAPTTTNFLAQVAFLTAAPTGQSTALAWQSPVGTTSSTILYAGNWLGQGTAGPQPDNVQVTAGLQYTASWYTSRASSADATVAVQGSLRWYNAAGASIATSHGSSVTVPVAPSWSTRVTVTGTAPAGAVWARIGEQIMTPATTTAANSIYHAGYQMEQSSAATTWMDPGPTGYIFTGFYERFPQTWLMSGTYGQVSAIGVDAEAVIAQDTLLAPFVEEILAVGPNFFYQLNDPSGSSSCVDSAARRIAAPIENAPFGVGSLTLGSSITSTSAVGTFVGTAGPVATFANTVSGPGLQKPEAFVNIAKTTVAPGPPTSGSWTRMIAFRSTTVPAAGTEMNLWTAYPPSWTSGNLSSWWFQIIPSGFASINMANSSNVGISYTGTTNLCDGNWHQMACVADAGSGVMAFYVDGVQVSLAGGPVYPTGIVSDTIGCSITTGTNAYCQGFVGDIACALELPIATSATQIAALYNSWRNASAGESSGARAQRVLNWIGYTGATAIDAGSTSNMGPASDLTGATGLDALNAIALTENGNLYVSSSGALTFTARSRRYNQTVPTYILGENVAGGEWPYESTSFDFDPTHLFNDIQVTQYSSSQVAESIDATSEGAYLQRVLQRTTNQGSFTETVDAANYLLQQYKSPRMRISDVTLHPSAVPGLWAVCMALEIGTRIRIMRRPPSAPAISVDCFVESVTWDVDPDTGDALVHLQCSPADLAAYWTLTSLHTTLNAQAASGQNQATINALPDSAVNALGSSLSQNTGYQLVFDPDTPIQETMTLATNGVPSTGIGYTTATLAFASNFAFTHAAGATVCEVLPAAVTNPAAYDLASALAPVSTTLNAAATSGTNAITVNALPDSKTNPASANWTTGDLIWIGVGTAAFEGYNLLTPNVSSAGEGVLPWATGTSGIPYGLLSDVGTPTVTASATAFQGANVWQVSCAGGVATPKGLLYVVKLPATALLAHTVSAYVRSVTSGANPQVFVFIKFLSTTGATLGQTNGSTSTLTGSATASWTRLSASATAPAGTAWIQIGIVLGTAPASAWTFQADGLQAEQNSSASTYQTCPQIASVGSSVAGYSAVTLTLAQNLAQNHSVGDYVCDPLPPGDTAPSQVAGTTRVTY
jgi:hypothetical protein